jgi:hypothetical protein
MQSSYPEPAAALETSKMQKQHIFATQQRSAAKQIIKKSKFEKIKYHRVDEIYNMTAKLAADNIAILLGIDFNMKTAINTVMHEHRNQHCHA